jgi:hypothetical protein
MRHRDREPSIVSTAESDIRYSAEPGVRHRRAQAVRWPPERKMIMFCLLLPRHAADVSACRGNSVEKVIVCI